VDPEVRSVSERLVLLRVGFAAVQQHPLFGLGAGTFTEWVARLPGRPAPIEPIHNVPLLVVAETGLVGILAWLVLGAGIARRVWRGWRRTTSWDAVWTAVLVGILVASMADHYWWTMAPMRTMFVIALALFAARSGYLNTDSPQRTCHVMLGTARPWPRFPKRSVTPDDALRGSAPVRGGLVSPAAWSGTKPTMPPRRRG
jgi:O-antigen ligase